VVVVVIVVGRRFLRSKKAIVWVLW
jgi:hypothetical protein